MSLNAHDRQALAQIEEAIADADPRFAAKLSAFSRLADGGAMPERERIREAKRRATIRSALRGPRPGQPGAYKLLYWTAVAMAVCITVAVICVALVLGHGGTKGTCAKWQLGVCVRQAAPLRPAPSGQDASPPSITP